MDTSSFLIFLVFCIVSSGVAILADNLGRKLGKKRLTLFGMRPKNFARLTVGLAGFLIPLLTLGLMWLLSKDVRVILEKGARAAEQLASTEQTLGERDKELKTKTQEVSEKAGQIARNKSDIQKLQGDQKNLKLQIERGKGDLTKLESTNAGLRAQAGQLRQMTQALKASVGTLRAQVGTLEAQYRLAQNETRIEKGKLDPIRAQNHDLSQQNLELTDQITKKQVELDSAKKQYEAAVAQLTKAQDVATKDLVATRNELSAARGELENTQRDLNQLRVDTEALRQIGQSLQSDVTHARMGRMIFVRGEELCRLRVPAGVVASEARGHVESALRSARQIAKNQGAGGLLADLFSYRDENHVVTMKEQEDELIQKLATSGQPMVLVLNSFQNSFEQEAVWVKATALPNPVVFRAFSVVGETMIDGRSPRDKIIVDLGNWLRDKVSEKAERSGMIPMIGHENKFGTIDTDRVFAIVDDIRTAARNIRVQAFVQKDIRAADRLDLDFRLR